MTGLVVADQYGREMTQLSSEFRKAQQPDEKKMGLWAGRDNAVMTLPGGAALQFDLSRLTLADFRAMKDHYQINSSLAVLSFMLFGLEWHIECEDKKIAESIEENLRLVWPQMIRGMSQSFWAGYSPMVFEFENDVENRKLDINRVKDLIPEECTVNWKEIEGYSKNGNAPPKIFEYDGIKQWGVKDPYPVENTFWYPLLMENGDYYGKKLLKPAFPSWFFSQLIHLFANRYFERFAEPLPVGRADFGDELDMGDGNTLSGRQAMINILEAIRSRAVAVLPSDRQQVGTSGTNEYIYDIDYLESQMRGGDFEGYLDRLDEEMSLALFTPVLMFRTGKSGSYNLGVTHLSTFQNMLNALAGDAKFYIDRYAVQRLKGINFSPKAPRAQWVPHPAGKQQVETLRAVVTELIRQNAVKPDTEELGEALGLTLEEISDLRRDELNGVNQPEPNPADDPRTGAGRPERESKRTQQPGRETGSA